MTRAEFIRRSGIIRKAIAHLQKLFNVKLAIKSIHYRWPEDEEREDDDNITIIADIVYTNDINFDPPKDIKLSYGFNGNTFNTEKWIEQSRFGDSYMKQLYKEIEEHVPSDSPISEENKAMLRVAYVFFRALRLHKDFRK